MGKSGSRRLVPSSMAHPFRGISGQSWAGRLKANIGTHPCCTTSRMARARGRDMIVYYAMRCSGVGASEAKTMYYALYKFGHHWKFPIKRGKPVKYEGGLV